MQKSNTTTAYKESLRMKIINAALPLFKQNGIRAVKMDYIASTMGISKRTLYEIYSNKEDLLFECVKHDAAEFSSKILEYAKTAGNEMEVMVYFMELKMKDFGMINPLFFSEMHKYSKIMDFLKRDKIKQRENSAEFTNKGIEHGFFRDDINFDIISRMGDAAMNNVMQNQLYRIYPMKEIFRTYIIVFMRACCTEKGMKYVEKFITDNDV